MRFFYLLVLTKAKILHSTRKSLARLYKEMLFYKNSKNLTKHMGH